MGRFCVDLTDRNDLRTQMRGTWSCRNWRRAMAAAFCVGMLVIVGCQQSPYELSSVRGTVTVDGKPLAGGRVMFAPISKGETSEPGKPAFGTVQSDGSYVLTTFRDNDGAVVGDHWVTIFGPKSDDPAAASLPKFSKYVVRQKLSVVAGQENQIDVQLTSQDIARFAAK